MDALDRNAIARVAVGLAAVIAQIALTVYYLGLAVLVVPQPSIVVLACLFAAQLVIVVWLAIRHTWYAPLVPVVSLITVFVMFEYGKANLGWGA